MAGVCMRAVLLVALSAAVATAAAAQNCEQNFPSTFAAIQKVIFEKRGCTNTICHGADANLAVNGGLDLRPDVAYDNLVSQPAQTVPDWFRVFPGQRDRSLLFQNVAAKTIPDQFHAPLRPMPLDPLPALSTDELSALRKWIEVGAPREATVTGTAELLNACLPPPKPIEIEPLPPPPAGMGAQIRMPRWVLEPQSEHEVCYATYFDVTDQVPEEYRTANGTFRYDKVEARQDPLSHHLIVNLYDGAVPITDSIWGEFKCRGGAKDGQVCDPQQIGACGDDSGCASDPAFSIACLGAQNLPRDAAIGLETSGFLVVQETATTTTYPSGVYRELPLKGIIIWNSHAFNLTDQPGRLEARLNLYFAEPETQRFPAIDIFLASPGTLFKMVVPPFEAEEVCSIFTPPANSEILELSSHMHQRGKRWRTFEGAWRCQGGADDGNPCSPFGPDEAFETSDLCAGAPCTSRLPPSNGDCNADFTVTIDELILGVNIVLGEAALDECPRLDLNDTGTVGIANLIGAVASALQPALRDAQESLIYTNFVYNDPLVLPFVPPRPTGGAHSLDEERSFTYCALYDNGFSDPATVKMASTSPLPPLGIPAGGPCRTPTGCTAGKITEPCSGNGAEERNASCDTAPDSGDGFCDACMLTGGVTTEDEMFLLLGAFFVNE
jgi:hypothetical protein